MHQKRAIKDVVQKTHAWYEPCPGVAMRDRAQARTSHQLWSRSAKTNEVQPSPRSIGCSSVALEPSSRWAFSTSSAEATVSVNRFTGRSGFLRLGIGSTTRYHGVEGCLMYTEILPPPAICRPRTSR